MPSRCSTTIFHLLVRSLIALRASVSAVNGRFKRAAQIDLACQGGPPSARSTPGTRICWLERHWGSGEGLARPPLCNSTRPRAARGAYAASLKRMATNGRRVRMLWQHDPREPIGIWDEVREDARGLYVKGRLLEGVARAREAAALIAAGALDGLSIGYRTLRAGRDEKGRRLLQELELWEVSLVTFPMLPSARVAAKGEAAPNAADLRALAGLFASASQEMARRDAASS